MPCGCPSNQQVRGPLLSPLRLKREHLCSGFLCVLFSHDPKRRWLEAQQTGIQLPSHGRVYRDCIKRNGDKTQMQSTHHNTLGFMGIVMTWGTYHVWLYNASPTLSVNFPVLKAEMKWNCGRRPHPGSGHNTTSVNSQTTEPETQS